MRLRAYPILVVVLLLASASPPPRVTNALIAATQQQDPAQSKKSFQSRARNRIGFPILVDACLTQSGIDSGRRKIRPSKFLAHRPDSSITIRTSSPCPTFQAPFRLRC
jgi:hypothetical protein